MLFLEILNKSDSPNHANNLNFLKWLISLKGRKEGSSYSKYVDIFLVFIPCESSEFVMVPFESQQNAGHKKPWRIQDRCTWLSLYCFWLDPVWFLGKNSFYLLIPRHSFCFNPHSWLKLFLDSIPWIYWLQDSQSWPLFWIYVIHSIWVSIISNASISIGTSWHVCVNYFLQIGRCIVQNLAESNVTLPCPVLYQIEPWRPYLYFSLPTEWPDLAGRSNHSLHKSSAWVTQHQRYEFINPMCKG